MIKIRLHIVQVRSWIDRFSAPEEDADLTPIKEYKTFWLVGHVTAKTSPKDTMPRWLIHNVKLSLDNLCYFIKHLLLLKSMVAAVYSMLLHPFRHVSVLNNRKVNFLLLFLRQLFGVNCLEVCELWRFTHYFLLKRILFFWF